MMMCNYRSQSPIIQNPYEQLKWCLEPDVRVKQKEKKTREEKGGLRV